MSNSKSSPHLELVGHLYTKLWKKTHISCLIVLYLNFTITKISMSTMGISAEYEDRLWIIEKQRISLPRIHPDRRHTQIHHFFLWDKMWLGNEWSSFNTSVKTWRVKATRNSTSLLSYWKLSLTIIRQTSDGFCKRDSRVEDPHCHMRIRLKLTIQRSG